MNIRTRTLVFLLCLGCLSIPLLFGPGRAPTAWEQTLKERFVRDFNTSETTERKLPEVCESRPGIVQLYLPVDNERAADSAVAEIPSTVTDVWRLHSWLPSQIDITVHPSNSRSQYAEEHWIGRRQGQQYRWECSTPSGPHIHVLEHWFVYDHNREQVKAQVLQTLRASGFGQSGCDRVGWLGGAQCNSEVLLLSGQFKPEVLLDQLDHSDSYFDLRLYLGPGHDNPGPTASR